MSRRHALLTICTTAVLAVADFPASAQTIDRPLIADNQQFLSLNGTTDNNGLCRNTYLNQFKVKVESTGLVFPFAQTYSSWNESEKQTEFANAATYRAAVSINKGPWTQLTWGGADTKECPFGEIILNDPLEVSVKPGDTLFVRTEIRVPPGGKWGVGIQSRTADDNPNWTEGATNNGDDLLLSDGADFRPQLGLYTHSSHGVYGKPVAPGGHHSAFIVGDSISPYVLDAATALGNRGAIFNVGQAAETAERVWNAGETRRKFFVGCDTLLFEDGVNDMRNRRTFEQLRSDATNIWEDFRSKGGQHLIVFTLTPLSRSTDKWLTEANQTPDFDPPERIKWNAWLRGLNERDVNIKITVIDTAEQMEPRPDSGIWKPSPDGKPLTDDGVHPNATGYAVLEKQVGPRIRAALLGEVSGKGK